MREVGPLARFGETLAGRVGRRVHAPEQGVGLPLGQHPRRSARIGRRLRNPLEFPLDFVSPVRPGLHKPSPCLPTHSNPMNPSTQAMNTTAPNLTPTRANLPYRFGACGARRSTAESLAAHLRHCPVAVAGRALMGLATGKAPDVTPAPPNPYLDGTEAARTGRPLAHNPHPHGSADWLDWYDGWRAAGGPTRQRVAS